MNEDNPGPAAGTVAGSNASGGNPAPPGWLADAVIYELYPQSFAAVGTRTPTRMLAVGYPLVYVRNGTHLIVVNPLRRAAQVDLELPGDSAARHLIGDGGRIDGGPVHADGFGCGVFELAGQPWPG